MSTKNKNKWASQALLEMDSITSAIKEESKNTLNSFLAEAVRNALREDCNEDEEEKDYDVIDDENDTDENDENSDDAAKSDVDEVGEEDAEAVDTAPAEPVAEPAVADAAQEEAPENGDEDGWDEFSQYQAGDNTYDLTGENDYEKVVKVYKLLKDDDQVVVRQDGDTIHLSDNEAGTEYVIDLGDGDKEPTADVADGEEMPNDEMSLNESDIAGFGDELDGESELDGDFMDDEFGAEDEVEGLDSSDELEDIKTAIEALQQKITDMEAESANGIENNLSENKKTRKPMKESKEVLFEVDLGYTDNYQDEDPIAGLSNDEPSKSGKSWHKGVPTGTKKPWAGQAKSKGEPFANVVSEEDEMGGEMPVEEGATSVSSQSLRKATKSRTSEPRRENAPKVTKKVSTAQKGYEDVVNENKKLKNTVKELKEAIIAIKKNLSEAYVTNANLGKITKLFLENTTSQAEKVDIVNRFSNEAKTIEQSKALYESIKRELSKTTTTVNINESVKSNSKAINESKVYKSDDLIKTIDFMNRVLNC
jgi:hypothetical protein